MATRITSAPPELGDDRHDGSVLVIPIETVTVGGAGHEHFEIGGARSRARPHPARRGRGERTGHPGPACRVWCPTRAGASSRARPSSSRTTARASARHADHERATGRYLFDFVESGTYSLSAELSGFKTVVQKSVRVQQRGDVTVDLKLEVGGIEETVTVTEATTTVQFNTATRDLTIEQEMVKELPSSTRNPLQLAMLDPTTIQRGSTIETQPYFHRTANEMDIGGGTKYRNDVLLDGTPLTAGNKLGYTPPDGRGERVHDPAELGGRRVRPQRGRHRDRDHEVGHERRQGLGLLLRPRRQPQRDERPGDPASTTTTPTGTPGATIGLPIKKNKLFLFAVFDAIENTQSQASNYSLPTALERQGDFSQSYNANGTLRVIYDPLTSRTVNGVQVRDPFPGNKIPAESLGPRGRADPGRPVDAQQRGRRPRPASTTSRPRTSGPSTTSTSRPASTGTSPTAGRPTRASAA